MIEQRQKVDISYTFIHRKDANTREIWFGHTTATVRPETPDAAIVHAVLCAYKDYEGFEVSKLSRQETPHFVEL